MAWGHGKAGGTKECFAKWNNGIAFVNVCSGKGSASVRFNGKRAFITAPSRRFWRFRPPPGGECPARAKPKLGDYSERIAAILRAEKEDQIPLKQRHTTKRIFERLREEGYTGGYTRVKSSVRELRRTSREVFVPLRYEPSEAQMGFGFALVKNAWATDQGGVLCDGATLFVSIPGAVTL